MCGRFNLFSSVEMIVDDLNVERVLFEPPPRYNISPGQDIASVHIDGIPSISAMKWGLTPRWSDTPRGLINARSETVFEKSSFREAIRKRRCVIPADGFFEWGKVPSGKQPYYLHREDDKLSYMAGIFEKGIEGNDSCCILTVPSKGDISSIHDRMPLILDREDALCYIGPIGSQDAIRPLFEKGIHSLRMHPVSKDVNSPSSEGRHLIEPIGRLF
ncbi:MAG: SOS response-associated peptidase [Candidatus Thermoplasmatota archaeon]|nr:SOS response-associated peptidase [Candidatus Thermoplasmatota archaeon]